MEKHVEERYDRIEKLLEETAKLQKETARLSAINERRIDELRLAIAEDHVDVMRLVVKIDNFIDLATTMYLTPDRELVSAD